MKKYIFKYQLISYFFLSFFITWMLLTPLVLSNLGYINISPHWHVLGSLGPITASIIITRIIGGNHGLKKYFKKFKDFRVGTIRFIIASFSPFFLFFMSLFIVHVSGLSILDFGNFKEQLSIEWIIGSLLSAIAYGFGEEAGWRGFALPRLQKERSAFWATLILTIFWAIWHIPMFFYRFEFNSFQIVGFFLGLFAGAILLTSIFNSTRGSILMVSLWHMNWNIVSIVSLELSEMIVSLMSSFIIIISIIIVLFVLS